MNPVPARLRDFIKSNLLCLMISFINSSIRELGMKLNKKKYSRVLPLYI